MRFIIVNTATCCTYTTDSEAKVVDYSIVNEEFTVVDTSNGTYKEYYYGAIFTYDNIQELK